MKITTNNQPRVLVSWYDLPESVKPDFDYIEGEDRYSLRLFCYRSTWYDTGGFLRLPPDHPEWRGIPWDGYQSDSYFTGTLLRYTHGYEMVVVGSYLLS